MSGRTELAADGGMIFETIGERDIQMWMKDTLIPLDMLFIDKNGVIVYIHPMAAPNDLTPISADVPVRMVIELAGGTCARLGIKKGSVIKNF